MGVLFLHQPNGDLFQGNSPTLGGDGSLEFSGDINARIYYLPGTTGWVTVLGHRPTMLWNPQATDPSVRGNQLGFTITGTTNLTVVVEACTDLGNPVWSPLGTNILTGGSAYFSDGQWTNYASRFYRLQSP